MSKYTLLFPTVEEMAEMLYKAGWSSPWDAQWEKLEGVMRDVRAIVEADALKQRESVPELQQKLGDETAAFKNFHANLCKRFNYHHDETDWRRDLASLEEFISKKFPDGMEHCTIQFKKCEKGHGRLTAKNWIDHGCPTCERDRLIDMATKHEATLTMHCLELEEDRARLDWLAAHPVCNIQPTKLMRALIDAAMKTTA